jgi:hypothetical protein
MTRKIPPRNISTVARSAVNGGIPMFFIDCPACTLPPFAIA